jgi:hypothetical protein
MRQDSEIKSDVISELEDIDFGGSDESILDQLMVEEVNVDSGVVSVALVFADASTEAERNGLVAVVKDVCGDLEGVVTVAVKSLTVSQLGAGAGRVQNGVPKPKSNGNAGGVLTMATLLGGLAEEPEPESESQNLYTGGGCEVGTAIAPLIIKGDVEPGPGPGQAEAPQTVVPAAVKEQPSVAPSADGHVVLTVAEYTELVRAKRELELRPTFEEHRRALDDVARLQALSRILGSASD